MLYTSYIGNLRNIPDNENTIYIFVTRWKPKINTNKFVSKTFWRPNLGPSETLLTRWKSGNMNWIEYRKTFLEEGETNPLFKGGLAEVLTYLNDKKDIYLLCYEKEDINCHRSILREYFLYNNIKCEEFKVK